ncbi:MAG: hypothetical protein ACKVPX_04630 [Myxococcaceae bacterium]
MTQPTSTFAKEILGALQERDKKGQLRFTREQVRDVVALLLLSRAPLSETPPPEALRLLGEFSIAAGVTSNVPQEVQAQLDAYFGQTPPSTELIQRLRRAGRTSVTTGTPSPQTTGKGSDR